MSSFLCDSPSDHSHPDSGGRRAQDEERRGTWNLYDIGREKGKRKGKRIREKIRDRRTGKYNVPIDVDTLRRRVP